jgi:hypothetical protein
MKKTIFLLLLLATGLLTGCNSIEEAEQSVGKVICKGKGTIGSGFIVDDKEGIFITRGNISCNNHDIEVYFSQNVAFNQSKKYSLRKNKDGKFIRSNEKFLTILQLEGKYFPAPLVLANNDYLSKGKQIKTIGYSGQSEFPYPEVSISNIINVGSETGRTIYQMNELTSGNGGSPLLNDCNEVVGIKFPTKWEDFINNPIDSIADLSFRDFFNFDSEQELIDFFKNNEGRLALHVKEIKTFLDVNNINYNPSSSCTVLKKIWIDYRYASISLIILSTIIIAILIYLVISYVHKPYSFSELFFPKPKRQCYLEGTAGAMRGKKITLKNKQPIVLGRDPRVAQIVFPKDLVDVSKKHAQVIFEEDVVILEDLNSTQGTYDSNGVKLSAAQRITLKNNDTFYLTPKKHEFKVIIK